MTARILLIDDHQIMRDGLRLLLREQPDLELVGSAFDSDAGWQAVVDLAPDLIVMDLDIPGEGGIALTARIRATHPDIKIVILTGHAEPQYIEAALQAGAEGYILKANGGADLLQALRSVLAGRNFLSQEVSHIVVNELRRHFDPPQKRGSALSTRESEVLKQIADGYSTKEIAFALGVSTKTIESHRMNLMEKLQINNVAELTKYALREGLTTLQPQKS